MSLFKSTLIATALVAAGVAGTASAADLTDNFEVRITIEETCNVLTASDIDFGSTIPTAGGQVDRTGTINVNCTNGTDYTLSLSDGGSGDTSARRMVGPSSTNISYQLYQDAARSNVWGNTTGSQVSGLGAGLGAAYQIDHTVYARDPGRQRAGRQLHRHRHCYPDVLIRKVGDGHDGSGFRSHGARAPCDPGDSDGGLGDSIQRRHGG